jgi:hypothetical protein
LEGLHVRYDHRLDIVNVNVSTVGTQEHPSTWVIIPLKHGFVPPKPSPAPSPTPKDDRQSARATGGAVTIIIVGVTASLLVAFAAKVGWQRHKRRADSPQSTELTETAGVYDASYMEIEKSIDASDL